MREDVYKFYACILNKEDLPIKIECFPFENNQDAKDFVKGENGNAIIPLCKYVPDFINIAFAQRKARDIFVKY